MSDIYLREQQYGKDLVRLVKVVLNGKWHEVVELTIRVLLEGDFDASYSDADNGKVIATDSMKNTVYILAKQSSNVACIELFAVEVAQHFVSTYTQVSKAHVSIARHRWARMLIDGRLHDHSFWRDGEDKRTTNVTVAKKGASTSVSIESGLEDLLVLKTTGSAFYGFVRDEYTTLPETGDRILSTSVDARYTITYPVLDTLATIPFDEIHESVRRITLHTFATHNSASVQATLYLMAKRVLDANKHVETVSYALPNKHNFSFDLERFGLKNTGKDADVFVPFNEPSGLIKATVARVKSKL